MTVSPDRAELEATGNSLFPPVRPAQPRLFWPGRASRLRAIIIQARTVIVAPRTVEPE